MSNQQGNSVKQQDTFRIIGDDDRKRLPNFNPTVVRLSLPRDRKGTGFLINKTTIITAAHNINPTTQLYNGEAKKILKHFGYGEPSSQNSPKPRDLALIMLEPPGIKLNKLYSFSRAAEQQLHNYWLRPNS
jgi:V8-like Glu-specific endopeptidase